jgi:large subunit ribosomal protein L21
MSEEKKYAIVRTGGKQYRVHEGDEIDVELLGIESGEVAFDEVLFVSDGKTGRVGAPHVEGATVRGELLEQVKGPKVVVYKYKRRQNYQRKVGHRQKYSRVKITSVGA